MEPRLKTKWFVKANGDGNTLLQDMVKMDPNPAE